MDPQNCSFVRVSMNSVSTSCLIVVIVFVDTYPGSDVSDGDADVNYFPCLLNV